ncbi:hypothetical protein BDN72DRAFT_742394, partial [Pluteus cervinus]
LHPVFHSSLLEPYSDPSEFHAHADPIAFQLPEDPALSIDKILDCRKFGHRFEYFIHFKGSDTTNDSWVPLSDIPTSFNELIDTYHRRHPRAP